MPSPLLPWLATLPWLLMPAALLARLRGSHSLDAGDATIATPVPRAAIVIPARDEARNIERCLGSAMRSDYPALEIIVVDDHSSDGTGDIARATGGGDPRVRVVATPPLPAGWFGKQWACASGARLTTADVIMFADADTWMAPELLRRAIGVMQVDGADLLSVAGAQEMHSVWERLVQPLVFAMLLLRYGGTHSVNRAKRAEDVIASGQCLLVRRAAYESLGGHDAVRDVVAEDLALAQRFWRAGKQVRVVFTRVHQSTRMYASLGELVKGWRKNVYAGGRYAMPGGRVGRMLYPLVLLSVPVSSLLPIVVLPLAMAGVLGHGWLVWSAAVVMGMVVWWALLYAWLRLPVWTALLYPAGVAVFCWIVITAIARGSRVEWKRREYVAG